MQNSNSSYILNLLELFYKDLPPAVPEEVKNRMAGVLEHSRRSNADPEELEKIIMVFGKYLWPYTKAFQEIKDHHHEQMGEDFFIRQLGNNLKKKYLAYKEQGSSFEDLYAGRQVEIFDPKERVLINQILVDTGIDVHKFAKQVAMGAHYSKYLKNIRKYKLVLKQVEIELDRLRLLAEDNKEDIPGLSDEILSKVQYFEHGLCRFAPKLDLNEIFLAHEYFNERRREKRLFKR
jgi:hypothetical protein